MVAAKCETLAASIALTAGSPVQRIVANVAAVELIIDRCNTLGVVPSVDVAEAALTALLSADSHVVAQTTSRITAKRSMST